MEHHAGIDVSLELSSVCVVDAAGRIVREAKVASEPEALIAWFKDLGLGPARIGLEAGPLSQLLYAALREAGSAVELLETRHVRDAFKAVPVKTDRKDARGIARLMRLGWFRQAHRKSLPAEEMRVLLTTRKLLQAKHPDVEMSLRGVLRGFGLKVGPTTPRTFSGRIREPVEGHPTLMVFAGALLAAREALGDQLRGLDVAQRRRGRRRFLSEWGVRRRARRSTDRPRRFPGQLERLPMSPAVVPRALHAFGVRRWLPSDLRELRRPAEPPRRRQEPHP